MSNKIKGYYAIHKELKKGFPKMSDFEILSLSIKIERNQILASGLNVSYEGNHPASLEAIAIALGFSDKEVKYTITDALMKIAKKDDL